MTGYIEKNMDRSLINVNVHPGAKKAGIEKISSDEFKIRVLAPPVKGEANKEVIRLIADYYDIPPSRVTIIRGHKSRRKLVAIKQGLRIKD